MSNESKTGGIKVAWVVIAVAVVAISVTSLAFSYMMMGMMKDMQAGQGAQAQQNQVSASDIASIVQDTIAAKERAVSDELMASALAPWEAATDISERVYGNPDARFSIVTFSDLECPFCKRFHDTPKEVVDASSGAVNYEFKHLPLDFHNPAALNGSVMVECVAKEKGNKHAWAFIDQYFKNTKTNGGGVADLDGLAKQFGLSSGQIAACKTDKEIGSRVSSDLAFAREAGVTGTPSSFVVDTVGGKSIQIGGAQGAEVFMNAIRSLLKGENENDELQDDDVDADSQ